MRRLLLAVCLGLLLVTGCKKIRFVNTQQNQQPNTQQNQQAQVQPDGQPAIHAPTGVVINPGGGGGGGGASAAVKKAAKRAATQNDMHNLRVFIDTASSASGKMPTAQEITTALQKEAPNVSKLLDEKVIALTGTKTRENIWAYTVDNVSSANYHLMISSSGIEQISPQALQQRLNREKGQ